MTTTSTTTTATTTTTYKWSFFCVSLNLTSSLRITDTREICLWSTTRYLLINVIINTNLVIKKQGSCKNTNWWCSITDGYLGRTSTVQWYFDRAHSGSVHSGYGAFVAGTTHRKSGHRDDTCAVQLRCLGKWNRWDSADAPPSLWSLIPPVIAK